MPRKKRDDLSAKLEASIVRKAKVIASFRGITMAEYLSEILRKPVDKDYDGLGKQIADHRPPPTT